jgi:hypothetical protein
MKGAGGVIVLMGGESDRLRLSGCCRTLMVFSFCQTKTLCTWEKRSFEEIFLENEFQMAYHGSTAEHNPHSNQNAGDNGRR